MKVLLYSGGVDSWLIDKVWKPDVKLYVNINGSYSKDEIARLPKDVYVIDCPFLGQFEEEGTKYIPLRNLYFLMIASNFGSELCLGATAGDWGAKDKTPEFFDMAEDMLNFLLAEQSVSQARNISIERRFVYMSKNEIMHEYLAQGGSIERVYDETFSCFNPQGDKPCMSCKPCFRRFVTLYENGYQYSQEEKEQMFAYIREHVVPRSDDKSGTYYKDRNVEGKDCEFVVNSLYEEFGMEVGE